MAGRLQAWVVYGGGLFGIGYFLMKIVAPSDEAMREVSYVSFNLINSSLKMSK